MKYLLLLLLCALLCGCATLAAITSSGAKMAGEAGIIEQSTADAVSKSADSIGKAAEDITPEQEYYIGRAVGANILARYKLYSANPAQTQYLNKICLAITLNSERPVLYNGYRVAILDSTEINAFATSGGHIFVTRGLIASTASEDELAAVIAHEIAHIQLYHSLKAIKTSRITQAIMTTGSAAASAAELAELTDIFDESVNEIVSTLVNKGYSQSQEFDADKKALALLSASGYDPAALLTMLSNLNKTQAAHKGGFNSTHPTPAKRIANAEKEIRAYSSPATKGYRSTRYKAAM